MYQALLILGVVILSKYKSRLLLKNVEALISTPNWLHDLVFNMVSEFD